MIRRTFGTFFLTFSAVVIMIFLYVILPQFLVEHFSSKDFIGKASQSFSELALSSPLLSPSPSPELTPVTIVIPRLNINTQVEEVGVTETNNLDVPKNAANVGWYTYGPKPSDQGNAVMTGHYDTPTGKPAIFYHLKNLESGDEIEVVSKAGIHTTFTVVEVASIPYDKFPNEYVFKTREGKNLNLITCGGIWNPKTKLYSERIVIYTSFKETVAVPT